MIKTFLMQYSNTDRNTMHIQLRKILTKMMMFEQYYFLFEVGYIYFQKTIQLLNKNYFIGFFSRRWTWIVLMAKCSLEIVPCYFNLCYVHITFKTQSTLEGDGCRLEKVSARDKHISVILVYWYQFVASKVLQFCWHIIFTHF